MGSPRTSKPSTCAARSSSTTSRCTRTMTRTESSAPGLPVRALRHGVRSRLLVCFASRCKRCVGTHGDTRRDWRHIHAQFMGTQTTATQHTQTHMGTQTTATQHTKTHTNTCTSTHTHKHMHNHIHKHMHKHTRTNIRTNTRARTHTRRVLRGCGCGWLCVAVAVGSSLLSFPGVRRCRGKNLARIQHVSTI